MILMSDLASWRPAEVVLIGRSGLDTDRCLLLAVTSGLDADQCCLLAVASRLRALLLAVFGPLRQLLCAELGCLILPRHNYLSMCRPSLCTT